MSAASLSKDLKAVFLDAARTSGVVGAQVSAILGDARFDFAYGSANLELDLPMTVDTVIQVGSVCKVLNAALIMSLVEDGTLALDTPVITYLPELRLADADAQNEITLRHLLSMSSGVDNGPYHEPTVGPDAIRSYVASLSTVPHVFKPGTAFGYSNAGTCIAGRVAEHVTGIGWDALMRDRLFKPLGLTNALTGPEDLPFQRVSVGHLDGYQGRKAEIVRPWYINRALGPAGSTLTMSARDLASFARIFVSGDNPLLSADAMAQMMTPLVPTPVASSFAMVGSHWGLGPSMDTWSGKTVWGHAGGNMSGTSRIMWIPEVRGVLALAFNSYGGNPNFVDGVFGGFAQTLFGVSPPRPQPVDMRIENAERFVGTYERYGARIEISVEQDRLRLLETCTGTGKMTDRLGPVYDAALRPLGGDKFVCDYPGRGPTPILPSHAAVGFAGSDSRGRAETMISPFLAARRIA